MLLDGLCLSHRNDGVMLAIPAWQRFWATWVPVRVKKTRQSGSPSRRRLTQNIARNKQGT